MSTRVVNLRLDKCDVKVTRTRDNQVPPPPAFGCFGNPFPVERHGRAQCIELFRAYFHDRLGRDEEFRQAVQGLNGKVLGCFCAPKGGVTAQDPLVCHGQIIAAYLDELFE